MSALHIAVVLISLTLGLCQDNSSIGGTLGVAPCDALLQAGLGRRLLTPSHDGFEASVNGYYNLNSRVRPWCILQPYNTQELSQAITALSQEDPSQERGGIAIRSGGHGAAAFASSIVNGVTFDLGMMNSTSYNASTMTASIGPGARWGSVYEALSPFNVTVSGGRDAGVGVGGLTLGGGIGYLSSRSGLACDTVTNFEVVLANGSIINANATHHSNLWRALKGGINNFGVVTRIDKSTIAGDTIWISQRTLSSNLTAQYIDALVAFTKDNNKNPENAIVGFFTHTADIEGVALNLIEVNTYGQANSSSFADFNRLPANVTEQATGPVAKLSTKYAASGLSAATTYTVRNDPRLLNFIANLHETYVRDLSSRIGPKNFTTTCFLEPIPAVVGAAGRKNGGNMLSLPIDEDVIVWDASISVLTGPEDLAVVQGIVREWTARVVDYAGKLGRPIDLIYANYAGASQQVIGSYGEENVAFMKWVAEAYDPTGFFQERVWGGFKLPG